MDALEGFLADQGHVDSSDKPQQVDAIIRIDEGDEWGGCETSTMVPLGAGLCLGRCDDPDPRSRRSATMEFEQLAHEAAHLVGAVRLGDYRPPDRGAFQCPVIGENAAELGDVRVWTERSDDVYEHPLRRRIGAAREGRRAVQAFGQFTPPPPRIDVENPVGDGEMQHQKPDQETQFDTAKVECDQGGYRGRGEEGGGRARIDEMGRYGSKPKGTAKRRRCMLGETAIGHQRPSGAAGSDEQDGSELGTRHHQARHDQGERHEPGCQAGGL